jgi:hypothetical protein
MAIVGEWREVLADEFGMPWSKLRHVERRLGEAGLLGERGPRGKSAPHLNALHGARLLIGAVAAFSDGASVDVSIARTVEALGRMAGPTEPFALADGSELIPAGSFEAGIAALLTRLAVPGSATDTLPAIVDVSLAYAGTNVFGEIVLYANKLAMPDISIGGMAWPPIDDTTTRVVEYQLPTNQNDALDRLRLNQFGLVRRATVNRRSLLRLSALLP